MHDLDAGNLEDLLRPMLNTTLKNDNVVKVPIMCGGISKLTELFADGSWLGAFNSSN